MFENMTMGNAVTALSGFVVLLSVILIRIFGDGFLFLPDNRGILLSNQHLQASALVRSCFESIISLSKYC